MKRTTIAAVLLSLGLIAVSACEFNPDRLLQKITAAINAIVGGKPEQGVISCAVILFDQSVDPATNQAWYTPVYKPNDPYLWFTACLGVNSGTHSLPTYKASGYTQGGDPAKRAICWAQNPQPSGELRFPCTFDTRADFNWVRYLQTSFNGQMLVGALG